MEDKIRKILENTHCGNCEWSEADGSLINHCDDCCRAITCQMFDLYHDTPEGPSEKPGEDFLKAREKQIQYWVSAIVLELGSATQKFGPFNSTHEGYAVILEELDELWDKIKANEDKYEMQKEAIQVGAMALRFLIDCCDWR